MSSFMVISLLSIKGTRFTYLRLRLELIVPLEVLQRVLEAHDAFGLDGREDGGLEHVLHQVDEVARFGAILLREVARGLDDVLVDGYEELVGVSQVEDLVQLPHKPYAR